MFECGHCGEPVPDGRLACPECGSDARTGWQTAEEIDYQSVELPDDAPPPAAGGGRAVAVVGVVLVVAFLVWILRR